MYTWDDITHFLPREFDSPDEPGSGETHMDLSFVFTLEQLRLDLRHPLKINSGYRSPAHNAKVGGVDNSAHTRGKAADVRTKGWDDAFRLIQYAMARGIKRIGIALDGSYVHLDIDDTLPHPRIWFY